CLREMDRLAEAEKVLTEAGANYGESSGLFAEIADLATAKGDFDQAARCWKNATKLSPSSITAYTKGAEAMRKAGREAEADELLCVAVMRFKANLGIHLEYARSAHRRADWAVAAERWRLVRDRFPEYVEACQQEAKALAGVKRQGSGGGA